MRSLRKIMEIRFVHIEPERYETVYHALSNAHQLAAREAQVLNAHCIVLSPDMVMADGSLAAVDRLATDGARVVMSAGLRLCEETAIPALKANGLLAGNPDILRPRTLMRLALDHLHPETERLCFDSPQFIDNPVCLWSVGNDGLLLRSFHLHPLMIDLGSIKEPIDLRGDTIDGAFIGCSFGNWAEVCVETDSDNILVFSLSSQADRSEPNRPRKANAATLRRMAYRRNVTPMHRWFFTKAIKLHTTDLDVRWVQLEESTGLLAFHAMNIARLSNSAAVRLLIDLLREHLAFHLEYSRVGRRLLALRRRVLQAVQRVRDPGRHRRRAS